MLIMLLAEHDVDGGRQPTQMHKPQRSASSCVGHSARQPISASWHDILQSESSQANRSASRFHFGGFAGRNFGSTCSRAFRFVSRLACA